MRRNKKNVSVKDVAARVIAEDATKREQLNNVKFHNIQEGQGNLNFNDAQQHTVDKYAKMADSFVNFNQKMGIGADNPLNDSGYGFNPISRVRTLLEWIHRGSWLGGVAVDTVANDMTRSGVSMVGDIKPEDREKIEEAAVVLQIWDKINENTKWARLYGGSLAVMMIDGQDPSTPLRLETIGKGQFKGLLVVDRWMVEPSLSDLITDFGPDIGMPKFYRITADAPALPRMKIHYSRCLRQVGIQLPYWQRLQENMWGISVIERLYDRMVAFDSATTGAAQLVFKAYLRTYKIKGLRDIIAAGGPAMNGLAAYMQTMARYQGMEGVTMLDGEDEFEASSHTAFGGLSEALTQFAQQLSGALGIPLVRLFGQSPSGFSSGDTDLRMYYDSIYQQEVQQFGIPVTKIYRAIAQSEGIALPDGFKLKFKSLWQLEDQQKAEISQKTTATIIQAQEAGLISDKVAVEELRTMSESTGLFSNISNEDLAKMDDVPEAPEPEALEVPLPKQPDKDQPKSRDEE